MRNANHISFFNDFYDKDNFKYIRDLLLEINLLLETDFELFYDKKTNFKLFVEDKELKYYFRIYKNRLDKCIDVHYKNENDYFIYLKKDI